MLPRCSRQHRYSYYQRFGHVYSKQQVIPKQPTGAKEYGTNHELEIWPLNFRWWWPVWWWHLSHLLRISRVYPNTHVAIHVYEYVKQPGCAPIEECGRLHRTSDPTIRVSTRPNNDQCNGYELSEFHRTLRRLESCSLNHRSVFLRCNAYSPIPERIGYHPYLSPTS